jgi:hypothetical protein
MHPGVHAATRVNAIVCGPFHSDSLDKVIPTMEIEEAVITGISLRRIATPRRSWARLSFSPQPSLPT